MIDDTFTGKLNMYDIALIPEFQQFSENRELKLLLKEGASSEHEFVERVATYIERSVLGLFHHDLEEDHGFIHKLYAMGYSKKEVAHALALAWLHNDTFFCLPKRSLWVRKRKVLLLIAAFLLSFITIFEIVEVYKHEYNELVAYMLVLAPVLGALGFVLTWVYFLLLSLLFGFRR